MKFVKQYGIFIVILIVGFMILLYPFVSNYISVGRSYRVINSYNERVTSFSNRDFEKEFKAAEEYNSKLITTPGAFFYPKLIEGYNSTLNVDGNGMIGYITIDKIKVNLPICHGTDEKVLSYAVGHLEGSSLPIGGDSSHSILSAHRGLPSATLFTHLDRMDKGDIFYITIMNKVFSYQVDRIEVVEPNNPDLLRIQEGKDYCTLMTCTPYGINTHRLLVRGVRVDSLNESKLYIQSNAYKISSILVAAFITGLLIIILLISLFIKNIFVRREKYETDL